MEMITQLHVNGTRHALQSDGDRTLLSILRDDLGLTGSKYGCGEGFCGACTVLIDGEPTRSCNTRLADIGEKRIQTIEGLAHGDKLDALQQAFLEVGALQCGYCTPGMIMSAAALLATHPQPSREDICGAMEGNICRCGAYARIVSAIQKAAQTMKGGTP
jgi:nicotinate dehydrogenase subunit A